MVKPPSRGRSATKKRRKPATSATVARELRRRHRPTSLDDLIIAANDRKVGRAAEAAQGRTKAGRRQGTLSAELLADALQLLQEGRMEVSRQRAAQLEDLMGRLWRTRKGGKQASGTAALRELFDRAMADARRRPDTFLAISRKTRVGFVRRSAAVRVTIAPHLRVRKAHSASTQTSLSPTDLAILWGAERSSPANVTEGMRSRVKEASLEAFSDQEAALSSQTLGRLGPFYAPSSVSQLWQARSRDWSVVDLLACPVEEGMVYPVWQFNQSGDPDPQLRALMDILRMAYSPWTVAAWMCAASPETAGSNAINWIVAGGNFDEVRQAAASDVAHWLQTSEGAHR